MDKNGKACMKMPRDIRYRNPHIATCGKSDLSQVFRPADILGTPNAIKGFYKPDMKS
jgi:hypothetical protein